MKHDCPSCKCEVREYITITKDMPMQDRMRVAPALGRILTVDMGKRVYFVNNHPQVESQEQFKKRIGGTQQ